MKRADATRKDCESEEEVRKVFPKGKASQASKFSASYWYPKVYRQGYTEAGKRRLVKEWYVQIQHAGKRNCLGLGTNNREEASRKAAQFYKTLRGLGWAEALKRIRPDSHEPRSLITVGDFIQLVTPILTVLDVRARSINNYSYAMRKITADIAGIPSMKGSKRRREKADQVRLDRITPLAVEKWKADFIESGGDLTPMANQQRRRSVNSFLRNARALFSRRVIKRLKELGVVLPDPLPFQGVELERRSSNRYESCIDAAALLKDGRKELANNSPEAWKIILLALGAGLRRGEIDGLCRSQIDYKAGEIRIRNHEHFEAKNQESQDRIFVDPELLQELRKLMRGSTSLFVVEPETKPTKDRSGRSYRCEKSFREATAWLKSQGVLSSKPLHTLRKEFGSILAAQSDIHTASRQLRHADISTTAAYYADHRRRAVVGIGAMLNDKEGQA